MVNAGTRHVRCLQDKWTQVTRDGKKSAHFEHTLGCYVERGSAAYWSAGRRRTGTGARGISRRRAVDKLVVGRTEIQLHLQSIWHLGNAQPSRFRPLWLIRVPLNESDSKDLSMQIWSTTASS